MTKELFVSSTPHETKVGMVEDDQLAEVYLERENEYTLAGSIYKGRVTRVGSAIGDQRNRRARSTFDARANHARYHVRRSKP